MKTLKKFLFASVLVQTCGLNASLKEMHDLVVVATQDQKLASNRLTLPYIQPGKSIAAGIRERADSILDAGRRTAADATACAAKLAAAERRVATAETRTRAAETAAARPLPPTENPALKVENARLTAELEKIRREAADKDTQILELIKQLREAHENAQLTLNTESEKIREALKK